jgi:hypothetical protein
VSTIDGLSREQLQAIYEEVFQLRRRVVELDEENRRLRAQLVREAPPVPAVPASGFAFGIADATGRREVVVPGTIAKIGTHASCHIKLVGARWMHAAIERGASGVTIVDLGTAEGTWVNGQRITKAPLASGDCIGICDAQLIVVFA